MLHALGITHVVSVGECALVPPSHLGAGQGHRSGSGSQHVAGRDAGHGSLWIEEREGRIKVLDIKGVCDDGIDTLEPQLGPICDWIDKARQEGGKVLVHCRVGVSRSATVTVSLCFCFKRVSDKGPKIDCVRHEVLRHLIGRCLSDRAVSTALRFNTTQHEAVIQPVWLGDQACKGTCAGRRAEIEASPRADFELAVSRQGGSRAQ
jgi:hypothetical protein